MRIIRAKSVRGVAIEIVTEMPLHPTGRIDDEIPSGAMIPNKDH